MRIPRIIEKAYKLTEIQHLESSGKTWKEVEKEIGNFRTRIIASSHKAMMNISENEIQRQRCNIEVTTQHVNNHRLKCDTCLKLGTKNPVTNQAASITHQSAVTQENDTAAIVAEQENSASPVKVTRVTRSYTDEERNRIMAVFGSNNWNVKQTSEQMGVPEGTLRDWAKKAGIVYKQSHPNAKELKPSTELKRDNNLKRASLEDSAYYSKEFKQRVIADAPNHESWRQLAEAHGVDNTTVTEWMRLEQEKPKTIMSFTDLIQQLENAETQAYKLAERLTDEVKAARTIQSSVDELSQNEAKLQFLLSEKQRLLKQAGL